MTPYKAFSVETPFGANYYAIIVETDENGTAVYTNRSGRWEPDTQFMPLDLSHPEFEFLEWDIREVPIERTGFLPRRPLVPPPGAVDVTREALGSVVSLIGAPSPRRR